jgi:hypothetical protein
MVVPHQSCVTAGFGEDIPTGRGGCWGKIDAMRNAMGVLGVLMVLFGVLFTLQGVGKVQGSFMSNTTTWTVLGPIIALIGLGLAISGWRRR